MSFDLRWTPAATETFEELQAAAAKAQKTRMKSGKTNASKQEGLFKQVVKAVQFLAANPKHPSLHTHEFHSLAHPFDPDGKVFEAYAQNRTPGAYRIFWCYGPGKGAITIIAITPHP